MTFGPNVLFQTTFWMLFHNAAYHAAMARVLPAIITTLMGHCCTHACRRCSNMLVYYIFLLNDRNSMGKGPVGPSRLAKMPFIITLPSLHSFIFFLATHSTNCSIKKKIWYNTTTLHAHCTTARRLSVYFTAFFCAFSHLCHPYPSAWE